MTAEEKDEITALCNRVVEEKDPTKFRELVVQLNDLLERKGHSWKNPSQGKISAKAL